MKDGWERVSSREPCPICGSSTWCLVGGSRAKCMRESVGSYATFNSRRGDPVYYHNLDGDESTNETVREVRAFDSSSVLENRDVIKSLYLKSLCDERYLFSIAKHLSLSEASLMTMGVGFISGDWIFPEFDNHGICGLKKRSNTRGSCYVIGSRAGISFPNVDIDDYKFVLIVEGHTDVAACLDFGIFAIGRPSNTGGAELIAEKLKDYKGAVVVAGERDFRRDDRCGGCRDCSFCFPGKIGMRHTVQSLYSLLNRTIWWTYPPRRTKDLRDCKVKGVLDPLSQMKVYKYKPELS